MKYTGLFLFMFLFSIFSFAQHAEQGHENSTAEEEFNATETIMHHIKDAHEWHLWTTKDEETGEEHHTSIPLPVILIYDGHLDVFMSSAFHHGHHNVHKGDREYVLHHGAIYLANEHGGISHEIDEETGEEVITNAKPYDFSITKNVAGMLVAALLIILIFAGAARAYKKRPGRPKGLQSLVEPVILFIRDDIARPNIGEKKYARFLPYLLTVFFFILINNLLGLVPFVPGGANVTGNIAVTFVLALLTMIITNVSGNKGYWGHIFNMPGVPWWLKVPIPIMPLVELVGVIAKPFALMIRLFANITAGHIIVLSLVSLIFIFKTAYISPLSIVFVLFMDILEILVAFLQAYIFTLLSGLFIGMAVEEHH